MHSVIGRLRPLRACLAPRALVVLLAIAPGATIAAQDSASAPPRRDSLEARVRLRTAQIVRTQLGLTDDQMRRLGATNRKFESQRRVLFDRERDVRTGLRDEIGSRDSTRGPQVATLLDRMLSLQREQLDLFESEQKELATFLSPIQRARYFGMQEQIRRRMMELSDRAMRGPPGGGQPGGGLGPGARPGARPGMRPGARPGGVRRPPGR